MLGLYLLVGLFMRASAWAANGFTIIFLLALVGGALRGLEIDCGCFGPSAGGAQGGNLLLAAVRDVGLLTLGLRTSPSRLGAASASTRCSGGIAPGRSLPGPDLGENRARQNKQPAKRL
jgi:hypothetical protein